MYLIDFGLRTDWFTKVSLQTLYVVSVTLLWNLETICSMIALSHSLSGNHWPQEHTLHLSELGDPFSTIFKQWLKLLRLLAWQSSIYYLWTERKNWIHQQRFSSTSNILYTINSLIRNKLFAFRSSITVLSSQLYRLWMAYSLRHLIIDCNYNDRLFCLDILIH